jgi:deoxyribodipyrimidine photo-lyase
MHLFIFNRGLRLTDNTTLIKMMRAGLNVTAVFIFTEQVDRRQNAYFSNQAVEFMVESLTELAGEIERRRSRLYFFHAADVMQVLKSFLPLGIKSLGVNFDYTPYARARQDKFKAFCDTHHITLYMEEDHILFNIADLRTLKADHTCYTVFTPFKNNALKKIKPAAVNKFRNFKFESYHALEKNPHYITLKDAEKFYTPTNSDTRGSRRAALAVLQRASDFMAYSSMRDHFTYPTTRLAAHNHFGTVSIREVYAAFKKNSALVNELIWRDFYTHLYYHFPHMLAGQVGRVNQPFRPKYAAIQWRGTKRLAEHWCNGTTGMPLVDAAMRQLNATGFMPNRLRMVTASTLTKLFSVSWRVGEQYFATKLRDYDAIQNSAGWAWTITGIDPQQVFRMFSPSSQSLQFDAECKYILTWVPELAAIPHKDIHRWETAHVKYPGVYLKPVVNYTAAYHAATRELIRVSKLK